MPSRNTAMRRGAAALTALLWVMLTIGLYFFVYKPFSPEFAEAVGGALLDVAVMLVFTAVAGGLGRWLLSQVPLDEWSRAENLGASVLLGLSGLAPLILLVGSVMLNVVAMALLLVIVALVTRRELIGWLGDLIGWLRSVDFKQPENVWDKVAVTVIALALILALLMALLPETKWDSLTYHLAGPQQYVQHGRIFNAPFNHFLGFPQQTDILYAGQIGLTGRTQGSGALHWAIGAGLLLLVGGMTARRFGLRAALIAVGALIVGKSVWLEMSFAYSDLMPMGLAAVGLNIVDAWVNYRNETGPNREVTASDLRYVIVVGMAAGFAMGSKYTVLWLGVALGLLILWSARGASVRAQLIYALAYGLAAVIVLSPWLVRNVLWYDNPIYPLIFESGEMDAIRYEWYSQPGTGMINTSDAWQLLIFPVAVTVLGVEGAAGYSISIGPLYLLLVPLLVLVWGKITHKPFVRQALLLGGSILLIWFFAVAFGSYANRQTRLVLYMFPAWAILAGLVMEALYRLPKKPFDVAFVTHAMVAMVLVFAGIDYTQDFIDSGFTTYFAGQDDYDYERAYLERNLGWHIEAMRQINNLPEDSTVRFLWEPRYLYCDEEKINCHTDSLIDGWYYARRTIGDGSIANIAAAWQDMGFDYLLVAEAGRRFVIEDEQNPFYTDDDWPAWDRFTETYLDEVWVGGRSDDVQYIIYTWKETAD